MQEEINKVKAYLGFAIKSGKILFGYDNVLKKSNKVKLIIICKNANEKIESNMLRTEKLTIKLKDLTLSELVNRENVKVIGLTDDNLSKAIINYGALFIKLN